MDRDAAGGARPIPRERVAKLEALPGWTWTVSQDVWDEKYELVERFAEREGHARVPQSHVEDGVQIGTWVGVQRQKRAELPKDRRVKLEALPGWSWDPHEDRWQQAYALVQQFGGREGHTRVPDGYFEDGLNIGSWVLSQRMNRDKLSADKRTRLEALPGWVWDARTDLWEQGYSRLVKYAEERGTSQVPNRYETEDGYALASWLNTVRGRGVKGSLEPERMKQLEALPAWTWTPKADSWDRAFNLLLQYVEEHGNALVPQSYRIEGFMLGAWVGAQRRNYAKGTLKPDREKQLRNVTGWVWRVK